MMSRPKGNLYGRAAANSPPKPKAGGYGSPLDPTFPGAVPDGWRITEQWGEAYQNIKGLPSALEGQLHSAIDIWRKDALGAPVYAVADGTVQFAGIPASASHKYNELAYEVTILHKDGMVSRYCHMGDVNSQAR